MSKYRKTFAALVTAIAAAIPLVSDGHISGDDKWTLALLAAGVLSVWATPNTTP